MSELLSERLAGMISIEQVDSTKLGASLSPVFNVGGDVDADGEDSAEAETFEHAAILHRPTGQTEAVVWRRGDEVIVLGSKVRGNQESVEAGEVMLRSYGSSAATILLKPDGGIYLGTGATEFVARADRVEAAIDALKSALQAAATTALLPALATAIGAIPGASGTGCDDVRGI